MVERLPNSTWNEFRDAVIYCAKQDTFTGSALPDIEWGYGKIDAFSMMTVCATSLSTTENSTPSLMHVFPVPANGQTAIQITGLSPYRNVSVINSLGQVVYSATADNNGNVTIPPFPFKFRILFGSCINRRRSTVISTDR
jgi:hypothetical protein